MNDNPEPKFPSGQLNEQDEGLLKIRMGIQEPSGTTTERTLVVDFGKNISWMAFGKTEGAEFARLFLERLAQAMTEITKTHAPIGSKVTCEKCGKSICEIVADDVKIGYPFNHWSFGGWHVPEPHVGQSLDSLRCECGSQWVKQLFLGGNFIHLEGYGWWPRNPIGVPA